MSNLVEETTIKASDEVERIFQAHHGLVFRTAYRITGDAGDAEDVLQTVFLRLIRSHGVAATLDKPENYLRRAAVNAALDVIRARRNDRFVPLQEEPSAQSKQTESADISDLRHALADAIARLQPRAAEVFALRFLEGWGNRKIAQTLGLSQVLVAVIVHRTRRRLRKELHPYLGGRS